jgi:hypothetical protein
LSLPAPTLPLLQQAQNTGDGGYNDGGYVEEEIPDDLPEIEDDDDM